MQNDSEIYVDPEEDEVFFGYVSEKEKTVCAKLVNYEGSNVKDDLKLSNITDDCAVSREDEIILDNKLMNVPTYEPSEKTSGDAGNYIADSVKPQPKLNKSFCSKDDDLSKKSSNMSVELEHNYSTPMKHKIDKSILTTPKSIVKADKDGGFLKVLSEIALVKAEAEGDKKCEKVKMDEDKENMPSIPEIKITEATPEKVRAFSPARGVNSELRLFRIIYNSPKNEDNVTHNSKSHIEAFESERNLKNNSLNEDVEKFSLNDKRQSINLIDFKDFTQTGLKEEQTKLLNEKKSAGEKNDRSPESKLMEEKNLVCNNSAFPETSERSQGEADKKYFPEAGVQTPRAALEDGRLPKGLRFSKEARKIVEVLKKSSVEDALNFTIPEVNTEEEEISFLSLDSVSVLDETVVPRDKIETQPPKISAPNVVTDIISKNKESKSKTVEKARRNLTPTPSQRRPQPIKYFSETKNECSKRLPFEDKRPPAMEKVRGGTGEAKTAPSSRIPVFGAKGSKIPLAERTPRPVETKVTPSKTPSVRTYKNSKFNHIESPINAYIHNKPTSLVVNIKPEVKKNSATKVCKAQTAGGLKKIEEKRPKTQASESDAEVRLPFVEYKSTTPFKIERRPESRLPRLAPTMMKLIGSHSPKVLRHEGRYFVNSPRGQRPTEDGTIVADPNEVSVLVSRPAQKSNTIK